MWILAATAATRFAARGWVQANMQSCAPPLLLGDVVSGPKTKARWSVRVAALRQAGRQLVAKDAYRSPTPRP